MDALDWIFILFDLTLAVCSAGHALLFKRDPRSALGWISVCLMFPLAGPILYFLLGINRIRIRAMKLESDSPFKVNRDNEEEARVAAFQIPPPLDEIVRMSNAVIRSRTLICGNRIEALFNGEQAYPAMIEAIDKAEHYVFLSTYIFETNETGKKFIHAMKKAKDRGIDVRVIIDGVGELYSFPRAGSLLKKNGIRFVRFIPPGLFPPKLRINLRNHRKILVADGRTGFVGGMNIGDSHLAEKINNPRRVIDIHFQLKGPVVTQVEQVFLEDWRFSTKEELKPGPIRSFNEGNTICRTIVDGPNINIDRIYMILNCAVSSARREISIMTPYFLPPPELIAVLQAAALRGVSVNILLPEKNNLPFVQWATMNTIKELLEHGVKIRLQPPPFVHTKLFIVDGHYAQIGSANLDTRSMRLNFELMIEIYSRRTVEIFTAHFKSQLEKSVEITLETLENRSFFVRIRDALAWLGTPYL